MICPLLRAWAFIESANLSSIGIETIFLFTLNLILNSQFLVVQFSIFGTFYDSVSDRSLALARSGVVEFFLLSIFRPF
ncbi:Hypothetical predicted protein [Olea europaea subsp. europaea]|uniref:Uncharacterized protein n=1 Tax=Olea europaea subsp. europaea TaxID=158383 RepID=A0A8S0RGC9_OLEEU|nr:Hypothetical predicted protein [Olea europaea subsp. europaea]